MKNWKNVSGTVLMLLFLAAGYARGQVMPRPDILDPKARAADPRLNTVVTLDANRMCLGEVLEKISAQTEVSVSIPATDPCSGILITCHVKNLSLADFLNSLWSVVGYTNATWQITADSKRSPRTYNLLPTPKSRQLADSLNAQSDKAEQNLWNLFTKIAKLTPKERQQYVHPLAEALLMETDETAKDWLQDSQPDNDLWERVHMVETELSVDERKQLAQGATIEIPLSRMTKKHQELACMYYGRGPLDAPPDMARFSFSHSLGDQKNLMRELFIGAGVGGNYGEGGTMNALTWGLRRLAYESWILPGDAKTNEKEAVILNALPDLPAGSPRESGTQMARLLTQLANAQDFSYIAVVPYGNGGTRHPDNNIKRSVGKICEDLQACTNLRHKWREGVLLFNSADWFYGNLPLTPYSVIKQAGENQR